MALAVPAAASADILLSGFWGRNYKTRLGENIDGDAQPIDNHSTWGGALAILGGRGFGIEVDVGHIPDFFAPDDLEIDVLDSNHVTTVMGNLLAHRRRHHAHLSHRRRRHRPQQARRLRRAHRHHHDRFRLERRRRR